MVHYVGAARELRPAVVLRRREGALLSELDPAIPVFDLNDPDPVAGVQYGPHQPGVEPEPPTGFKPQSLVELIAESRRLTRVVESTGCEIVSSFLMRAHIIALLTKRFLRPDLCVVLNIHEHMSESEPHLYPSRLDRFLMRWTVRHLFPVADRIVVVAESLAEDLIGRFGVDPDRVVVLHNPLHLAGIRQQARASAPELSFAEGRPVVVGVGRLVHLKGFDLLIEALARLPERDRPWLALIGDGPERADLEGLATRLEVRDRVRFLGMQANPWRLMRRATLLALPSRTEAFPNVLGEALALGLPVVAAECSAGVREYLDDGECGLLVEPEDPEALAAGLTQLLGDELRRDDLSRKGLEHMRRFDLPEAARRYENALLDAVSTRRGV